MTTTVTKEPPTLEEALAAVYALLEVPAARCPDCSAVDEPCLDGGMVRDALRDLWSRECRAREGETP